MKKITSLLLCIVLLSLSLVACGGKGPDKALAASLAQIKAGEFSESDLLADSAYAGENQETLTAMYTKFDYTVGEATVDGETATVAATITMVDISEVFSAYMVEAFSHIAEEDWDADAAYFMQLLTAEDAATKNFDVTVNMVLVDGEWTVAEEGNDALFDALTGGLMSSLDGLFE